MAACHAPEGEGKSGEGTEGVRQAATTAVTLKLEPSNYTGPLCGPGGCAEGPSSGPIPYGTSWQITAQSAWVPRLSVPLDGDNAGMVTVSSTGGLTYDSLIGKLYNKSVSGSTLTLTVKATIPVTVDGTGYTDYKDLSFGPRR